MQAPLGLKAALLGAAALVFFALHLGARPVATRGEGREALVVKNMLEQGDFVLPLRNEDEIPSKPPLFHWAAAAASGIFGSLTEFSLRLPSALAAALLIACMYFFVAHYGDSRLALLTALICASCFEFARSATHARVDMCFAFALSATLLSLYRNLELWAASRTYNWFWLSALSASAALAVLAKGPAALILAGFAALVMTGFLAKEQGSGAIKRFPFVPFTIALVLSIVLSGLWYWLAYVEHGQAFLEKQLFRENLSRMVHISGETEELGHHKPFYFGLIHLVVAFLPWSCFLPLLIVWLWKERAGLLERSRRVDLFMLVWVGTVLLAVTMSQSKRVVYLLPALPALSFLLARAALAVQGGEALRACKLTALPLSVLGAALLAVLSAGLHIAAGDIGYGAAAAGVPRELARVLPNTSDFGAGYPVFLLLILTATVLAFSSLRGIWNARAVSSVRNLAAAILVLVFAIGQWVYPYIGSLNDPRRLAGELGSCFSSVGGNVASYKVSLYQEGFYMDRSVPYITSTSALDLNAKGCVVVEQKNFDELREQLPEARIAFRSSANPFESGKEKLLVSF